MTVMSYYPSLLSTYYMPDDTVFYVDFLIFKNFTYPVLWWFWSSIKCEKSECERLSNSPEIKELWCQPRYVRSQLHAVQFNYTLDHQCLTGHDEKVNYSTEHCQFTNNVLWHVFHFTDSKWWDENKVVSFEWYLILLKPWVVCFFLGVE